VVPSGATIVCGADATVERRSARKISATGCYREAGRSRQKPVLSWVGLQGVSMMLWGPVPWSRRVWALLFLTALR
jgi:hypothetical protein